MTKYLRLFFGPPCESWQSVTFGNWGDYCVSPHEKKNYLNPRSNKNIYQFEFPTLILYFIGTLMYGQISKTLFWTTLRIVTKRHFWEPAGLLFKPSQKDKCLNPRSNRNIFQIEFPTLISYFEGTLLYDQISKTLFWTTLRIVTKREVIRQ